MVITKGKEEEVGDISKVFLKVGWYWNCSTRSGANNGSMMLNPWNSIVLNYEPMITQ